MVEKIRKTDNQCEEIKSKISFNQLLENYIRIPRENLFQQLLRHNQKNKSKAKYKNNPAILVDKTQEISQSFLQIYPEQIVDLQQTLNIVLKKYDLDITISIHIQSTPEYTASMFNNPVDNSFVLMVSGVMIENLTTDELLFVIAHELGHFYLKHSQTRLENQFLSENSHIDKEIILQSLSRAEEVSADRLGLLFCSNLYTAVSAILKTVYQGKFSNVNLNAEQYIKQIEQSDLPRFYDEKLDAYQPWMLSHPPLPLRIRLLNEFNSSINTSISHFFNGRNFSQISQVNKQTNYLLSALEIDDLKPVLEVKNFYQHLTNLYSYLGGTQVGLEKISELVNQQYKFSIHLGEPSKLKKTFDNSCLFFLRFVSTGRQIRTLKFLLDVYQFELHSIGEKGSNDFPDITDRLLMLTKQLQLADSVHKKLLRWEE